MRKFRWTLGLVVFCWTTAFGQEKKSANPLAGLKPWEVPYLELSVQDTFGAVDTLFLEMKKGEKAGEWVLYLSVFNDESLFALSFPIRYDSLMTFDSVSLVGTRVDFFQTKMVNKKPPVPHSVAVGLFSALNPAAPSLPPGQGLVSKLYFKAPASRPLSIRSVAPILMPPNLELVLPKGAAVHPAIVRIGDAPSGAKSEPKPPVKSKRKSRN